MQTITALVGIPRLTPAIIALAIIAFAPGLVAALPAGARELPPSTLQPARRERGSKSPYAFTTTLDCHRARAAYFDDRPAVRKDGGLLWKEAHAGGGPTPATRLFLTLKEG